MSPRVVIAAPGSGQGKTTVATGLLGALRRRSLRVAPFKVGPDYIDPGYHRVAAGLPGRNLDPVLVGQQRIAPLFRHGSAGADIAVAEGVMGLFDGKLDAGADGPAFGSTAQVADLLRAPVVLVVDARGQSQSLAALLHGFRSFQPGVRLAGVILNQVGSDRHEQVLRDAAESVGLPVLGVLGRTDGLSVPSRHLGLITAAEHGGAASEAVDAMTDAVEAGVDLDAVIRLAREAPELLDEPWRPADEIAALADRPGTARPGADRLGADRPRADPSGAARPVIAVAGGPAFTFAYTEHVELLTAAGAEVAVLDPLRDERLPEGTRGLVLPGGFPEQHAAELSANSALRAEITRFAESGAPIHAECGGLLYLAEELDGHPLCGVLPARAEMSPTLTLGYREAVAATDSPLCERGFRLNGHEFHRTKLQPGSGADPAWYWRAGTAVSEGRAGTAVSEGFVRGGLHASYLHTHPAGAPELVSRFVTSCSQGVTADADTAV